MSDDVKRYLVGNNDLGLEVSSDKIIPRRTGGHTHDVQVVLATAFDAMQQRAERAEAIRLLPARVAQLVKDAVKSDHLPETQEEAITLLLDDHSVWEKHSLTQLVTENTALKAQVKAAEADTAAVRQVCRELLNRLDVDNLTTQTVARECEKVLAQDHPGSTLLTDLRRMREALEQIVEDGCRMPWAMVCSRTNGGEKWCEGCLAHAALRGND